MFSLQFPFHSFVIVFLQSLIFCSTGSTSSIDFFIAIQIRSSIARRGKKGQKLSKDLIKNLKVTFITSRKLLKILPNMPSIKGLTRISVLLIFCFQLFMGSMAYPIAEKANQESKDIEPRALGMRKGGKAAPLLGGALIGGGAALAYKYYHDS